MQINFRKIYLNFNKKLPFFILALLILLNFVIYQITLILPIFYLEDKLLSNVEIDIKKKRNWRYFYFTIFLISMVIICLLKAMFTKPGKVPHAWNENQINNLIKKYLFEIEFNNSYKLFKNLITFENLKKINFEDKDFRIFLKNNNVKFCKYCLIVKPNRSHHCRQCDSCVVKMDHHCNWIDSCIGFMNYKSFLLLILYLEIYLMFYVITYFELFLKSYLSTDFKGYYFFVISLNYSIVIILFSVISILFVFHFFNLTVKNITTIEFCETKNAGNIYNRGILNNLQEILGENFLLWFIPIDNKKIEKIISKTPNESFIKI